jgi:SsrA-binding protein
MPSKKAKKANAKAPQNKRIQNRRARFDYELGDSLTVGIQLSGAETKSLRMGHGQLRGAYVTFKDNQLWLLNAAINGTVGIPITESDQVRTRKLLAKRKEIDQLIEAKQQGRTIVPLELLTGGRYIKLKIAVGKGKKLYDKRQSLKARDESRNIQAVLKQKR